jgi:enoyl-[acyl-carrier protein] reductase II
LEGIPYQFLHIASTFEQLKLRFMQNVVTNMLGTQYPIIQAGMVWCSGWELAAASSNAGILGVIGSGSMYPEILEEHIIKCKSATNKPFAVNIPLLYPDIEKHLKHIIDLEVPVVITSAGSPMKLTPTLKEHGIKVMHVVSSARFAMKAQNAGVDAVICEGFEAGGHNGREETTSMCLIPSVRSAVDIPVIAAGGIGSGSAIYAAMALGADGVQIGTRFVASEESSAHQKFKDEVLRADEGSTQLTLKELAPVRLLKNAFFQEVQDAYSRCAPIDELRNILGKGRAKKGMFEGDLENGELEIGQVSAQVRDVKPVSVIVSELINEFNETSQRMSALKNL